MKIKSFFEFVEIQTKVASIFPFIFGVLYAKYLGYSINIINTILMLGSLLALDMATTAINNFIDFKKAKNDEYKYTVNVLGKHGLSEQVSKYIIFVLLGVCILLGLILTFRTDLVVLILGMFSFTVGVCYTYGPVPISRTPFGEIVSGFVMGFIILFLSVYIQNTNFIGIDINSSANLTVVVNLLTIAKIFIVSLPFVLIISNIMLGNNMRDLENDIKNHRYLLPYYLGMDRSLVLFKINYTLVYVVIFICIIINVLPISSSIVFLTIMKVKKNIKNYEQVVIKEKHPAGFKNVVINMMIISVTYITSVVVALVISS